MKPCTAVVVEKHAHFLAWCLDNRRNPRDRNLISISRAADLQKVYGLRGLHVVWYTIPRSRAEYEEIYSTLQYLS